MKSGFAISCAVAVFSFLTGSSTTPIVNPAFVKNLQNLLSNAFNPVSPVVGSWITAFPLDLFTMLLSLVVIWALASWLVKSVLGWTGIMIAFFIGLLLWSGLTGQGLLPIAQQYFKQTAALLLV